jgi:flagellar biosynthesis/type III secretory pathway protein FliH
MDASLHFTQSPRSLDALFADDFDMPDVAPEPEVIEPVFSAAEVANEREAAWRQGHASGLQEAAATDAAATRSAIEAVAAQFADARDAAAAFAEQSADAIARLLLESLAAVLPTLCARHGEAEVQAIVRAVLPALTREQVITIRANPCTAPSLVREVGRLDPDLASHVQIAECDAMPRGDVRIAWRNGAAARHAAGLWEQVAAILAPAGMLPTDAMTSREETVDAD